MENNIQNIQNITQQQEESYDYKALFFKLYRYWYFFILTIFIALLIAFLFNKYTKSVYEVDTTVLVKEDNSAPDAQALLGFGFRGNQQNVVNEIWKLKSYTLVNQAVRELNMELSYFKEDNFITSELYKDSPFKVVFDTLHLQPVNVKFKLSILSNKNYTLEAEGNEAKLYDYEKFEIYKDENPTKQVMISIDSTFAFGQYIYNDSYRFKIVLNKQYNPEIHNNKNYYFVFNDVDQLTMRFRSFEIEPIEEEASILKINLKGNNIEKSVDFLNKLTEVYLRRNLDQKNRAAENTIVFIDSQLKEISDSLNLAEQNLQDFRTTRQVMDLDFQAAQVFEQLKELESEKAHLGLKSKYYKILRDYIKENKDLDDVLIIPTTMGIEDPLLNQLSSELSKLYAEKEEKLYFSKSSNPMIQSLNKKIELTEATLLENINNIINSSNMAIRDINEQISALETRISQLPAMQRQYLGIERKFKLSDEMYTYLQERRSEAQITKASNEPDNEIIDIARSLGSSPVYPKKSMNYMIAIVLGLVLPIVYIMGKDYFNDKIIERKDVEKITDFPILGHIIHSNKDTQAVVAESPKSSIAESFRSVRTNLQFITKGEEKQTIL
nr:hypothetical protein [Bacteroidota bacterium]